MRGLSPRKGLCQLETGRSDGGYLWRIASRWKRDAVGAPVLKGLSTAAFKIVVDMGGNQ